MPRFWDVMQPHLDRMREEAAQRATIEAGRAQSEIHSSLIQEGWFGKQATAAPSAYADIAQQPQIEPSSSVYEEVWGESVQPDDLYGSSSLASPETESLETPGGNSEPTLQPDEAEPELE